VKVFDGADGLDGSYSQFAYRELTGFEGAPIGLALDQEADRLYVADAAGYVRVFADAATSEASSADWTLTVPTTYEVRSVQVDTRRGRLYVGIERDGFSHSTQVFVFDTTDLEADEPVATIRTAFTDSHLTFSANLALDVASDRLYVTTLEAPQAVYIYDNVSTHLGGLVNVRPDRVLTNPHGANVYDYDEHMSQPRALAFYTTRCALPWGGRISHGESIAAYASHCGSSCESELRTCNRGELSGSYEHESCDAPCIDCDAETLTWSAHACEAEFSATLHGSTDFQGNEMGGREGSATFTCDNGAWVETASTCEPDACSLPWGGEIQHEEEVLAYAASSAACGFVCEHETRTCSYGELSSGTYEEGTCTHEACADGTIYAGEYGGYDYYATPADQGAFTWNNGTENWTETGAGSGSDGQANTETLAESTDAGAPYVAAITCNDLDAHGHDDWFLPATAELLFLLKEYRFNIGGFNLTGNEARYWSSIDWGEEDEAFYIDFRPDSIGDVEQKSTALQVRCVRKDATE
jgi:hypothetical protein